MPGQAPRHGQWTTDVSSRDGATGIRQVWAFYQQPPKDFLCTILQCRMAALASTSRWRVYILYGDEAGDGSEVELWRSPEQNGYSANEDFTFTVDPPILVERDTADHFWLGLIGHASDSDDVGFRTDNVNYSVPQLGKADNGENWAYPAWGTWGTNSAGWSSGRPYAWLTTEPLVTHLPGARH